jgi:regulator of sirC expression with transglutaminase-like and TPR domain
VPPPQGGGRLETASCAAAGTRYRPGMFAQRDAIIRLLRDDDPRTVQLVKEQLASHGRASIPNLLDLLTADNGSVARHAREILHAIDAREAQEEVSELCRDFPDRGGLDALEYATFLLARAIAPGVEIEEARRQLDAWGEALAQRLPEAATCEERTKLLADFFGRELGFRGNADNYYSVGNSLLPEVVKSRLGIPITLALIYLFTGARAGIDIEGISFPGHFLIRMDEALIDPFARGKVVTASDCADILMRQNLRADPAYFRAAPPRAIFHRMLANLLYLYQTQDKTTAAMLEDWIEALEK